MGDPPLETAHFGCFASKTKAMKTLPKAGKWAVLNKRDRCPKKVGDLLDSFKHQPTGVHYPEQRIKEQRHVL